MPERSRPNQPFGIAVRHEREDGDDVEDRRQSISAVAEMGVRPPGIALQGEVSNHRKLPPGADQTYWWIAGTGTPPPPAGVADPVGIAPDPAIPPRQRTCEGRPDRRRAAPTVWSAASTAIPGLPCGRAR